MKKRNLLLAALLLILVAPSFAAKVDTLLVNSPSMNKDVQVVVVTPDAALGKKAVACPVIHPAAENPGRISWPCKCRVRW